MRTDAIQFPQVDERVPVVRRTPTEWQIGLDPGRSVILSGVDTGPLLALMDGRSGWTTVRDRAEHLGWSTTDLDIALSALVQAGAVRERRPRASELPLSRAHLRILGAGQLGRAVATGLVRAGVRVLDVVDPVRAEAACAELAGFGRTALRPMDHWAEHPMAGVDLTLIATDTVEPDRGVTAQLFRAEAPHLLVRSSGATVSVGPLVAPGWTSCLRCVDLARRDADPQWTDLLAHLTQLILPVSSSLLPWAAATAVVQVLAYLNDSTSETAGATLELGEIDYLLRLRSWPVHAGCGCSWSAPTEWGGG